jgi:tetratricopeptide (TPR) repeat protein
MSAARATTNPFPGLRPFTQEEDYLFFGREEQTIELLQRLGGNRFVAVVGTSGSGKSSLVRCGLLSQLLGGKMLGAGAAWEIAVTHPGGNPLALLTDAILDAGLYNRAAEHARENLLATLSRSHFGLVEAVKQADLGEGINFLLVVDQFEEIFRFHEAGQTQQEAANEFVSLLLEAAAQKDVPIYVVLTMRSDFIGECGQFEGLAEMVNRGEFLIPRLNREQYKRVIEGPIKVAGGQIAPRLLQRLLNDLGQQDDQLPCLQHALMRTWSVWAGNGDTDALDLDDYQRVGKMSQALSLHADEIYESLPGDRQRELCRGIFQALTVEESNSRGIRRPQRLGRLCQILEVPAGELMPIIDAYRQSGVTFLMPSPEVELTDQTIIDISHESLMRVWTKLRQWVEEETQAAGIYHRLSESASLHQLGKAGLYRDPELGIALAWRESKRPNAAWAERYRPGFVHAMEFLEASQQAGVAEDQAREAARQRELEQARIVAEAERARAETETRAARRLRAMLTGTALIAIFAVGASLVAFNFWRDADRAKQAAERSERSANESAQTAQSEAARATAQESAAKEARRDAEQNLTRARTAIDDFLIKVTDSQLLSSPGLQPLRAELLASASRFYADFLDKNPDNPALQAGLADAFYRVGFVNNELGNYVQALQALEKSIALWDAALKANPDKASLRHGLAAAWYECSRARMGVNRDNPSVYEAAKNAARVWDALAAADPVNLNYQKSLARAYNLMGLASGSLGEGERSFLAYQRSLRIRLKLLPDHPDDVELMHGLAESFNNLGLMIDDNEQRLAMLERSVEYNVGVNRLRPQNVEYAEDLSVGYLMTAGQLSRMNRKQAAMSSYSKGIDHTLQFIRANPAVPSMRDRLSTMLFRMRSLAIEPDQADDYVRIFEDVRNTFAALPRKTAADHVAFAEVQSVCAQQILRARKSVQKREPTSLEAAEIGALRSGALASLRQATAAGFNDSQRL